MNEDPMVKRAALWAARKHQDQKRLDGSPYFTHLDAVAKYVTPSEDPEIISAAYLHDSIEDQAVSYDQIKDRFSVRVADIVVNLTHDNRLTYERQVHEAWQRLLLFSTDASRLVKVGDVLSNLSSLGDAVSKANPGFEKRVIIKWERTLVILESAQNVARKSDLLVEHDGLFLDLHYQATSILKARMEKLL